MRRLLQKPANTCRCRYLLIENTSPIHTPIPRIQNSSNRRDNFGASRRQIAFEGTIKTNAQFSTVPTRIPSSSRCVEIQNISARFLSTEANYAHTTSNDVMMSPFWYHERANCTNYTRASIAPLELFHAIQTLKRVSSPKPKPSLLGVESYGGRKCDSGKEIHDPKAELYRDVINANGMLATYVNISDIEAINDATYIDPTNQSLAHELDMKVQQEKHTTTGLSRIKDTFQEERSSKNEILGDKQLITMFHHLIDVDVPYSFEVLKYYVARCKGKGRLVKMDMYTKLIQRLRPSPKESNPSQSATNTEHKMNLNELQSLVRDITQHIKDEYSDGKSVVYQYLLLPELMSTLMDYKTYDIRSMAAPIMDYILEHEFPMLTPELYEYILTKGRRGDNGQGDFPYGRLLAELVLSGTLHQPICS